MSNEKTTEPLLSDEVLSQLNCRCENCVRRVSACLEASRQQDKDRLEELTGLVQELVDALEGTRRKPDWWRHHPSEECIYDAINRAKEAGFTPNT